MNINFSHIIDLTQTIHPDIPSWEGTCGFSAKTLSDYDQGVKVQAFDMLAGIGTHIDAPSHFIPDAKSIADIPLTQLINPAIIIDVSKNSHPDYLISKEDIINFEKSFASIKTNCIVLFYTGWSEYWSDAKKYRNVDERNTMHFPGVSPEAAQLLLERNIAGIGIDTLSPDSNNMEFPVHHLLLSQEKFIIENMVNLEKLPPVGAHVMALPIKISQATESPCRVIGLV